MTPVTVLDNSNIVESYPGITLPLTYSFIRRAYSGVFRGIIAECLNNDAFLTEFSDIFDNMITSYQGRIYYCINNWYSLIGFMPFSGIITPVWQDMMGVRDKDIYTGTRFRFTVLQKARLYRNIIKMFRCAPKLMEELERDFEQTREYFDRTYSEGLAIPELISLYHEIERRVLDKWYVTLANDMYAFLWTGALKRGRRGSKRGHISGAGELISMKPVTELMRLAGKYGRQAEEELLANPEIREYIRLYGDRRPGELKLETVTYREDPSLLISRIYEYAHDSAQLGGMIENLRQRPEARGGFIARRARLGIQNREISRLNRCRIYGMIRRLFLAVGERLFADNFIDTPRDIFYLKIEEIFAPVYDNLRETVAARKLEYGAYEALSPPARLVFQGNELTGPAHEAEWSGQYTGVGTSMGSVTAEAVVLDQPDEKADVSGKIIVTRTTDPGWVFLLSMAKGIVAEKGSLLSHTAIIAREMKIPAVVAVPNASRLIKSGDIIRINGETGLVEILRKPV